MLLHILADIKKKTMKRKFSSDHFADGRYRRTTAEADSKIKYVAYLSFVF